MANEKPTVHEQQGLPLNDYYKTLTSLIRVNRNNAPLQSKIISQEEVLDEDYNTTLLRVLENSYKKYKKPKNFSNIEEDRSGVKLDSGSCFILLILHQKHCRDVIPDVELEKCKKVCSDMISKLSNCHEAHFGLAKLLTHEGCYEQAEQHLSIALLEERNFDIYNMFLGVIKAISADSKTKALDAKKLCESKK